MLRARQDGLARREAAASRTGAPQSHSLAFGAELRREGLDLHLILNAYWEPLDFELPQRARSRSRGGAGSTRPSTRRTTSSPWQAAPRGRRSAAPITRARARSWCCGGVSRAARPSIARDRRGSRLTDGDAWPRFGSRARCWAGCWRAPTVRAQRRTSDACRRRAARSAAPPKDPLGRDTPRGTVLGFMNAARDGRDEVAPQYLNTKAARSGGHRAGPQALRRPRPPPASASHRAERSAGRLAGQPARSPIRTSSEPSRPTAGPLDLVLERVNRGADGAGLAVFTRDARRASRTCTTRSISWRSIGFFRTS